MARDATRAPAAGWLPDEVARAGRENLDAGHVSSYDDKQDAGAEAEVQLLTELGLDGDHHVVDLGAGTGQLTLAVAPHCARVVAVDVSPVMLDRLRAKVDAAGFANVEVVEAGFLGYEHTGSPVDVVYSRWALHHLPDAWKAVALHRMRSILRPGGLLRLSDIVYSFEPAEATDRFEQWCASLPVDAATDGEWVRADVEEHVRDEHSTFTWLLEPMIERAGFRIERATHSPDGFFADYVARAV
jgi:ubiquinone/menaquinone biosynthesis C-methylase UbiE